MRDQLEALVGQMVDRGILFDEAINEFEKRFIRRALDRSKGNQSRAAKLLGIHRNTLSRTMAELGISLAEIRAGLKRPPRSERPVFGIVRQGSRQG